MIETKTCATTQSSFQRATELQDVDTSAALTSIDSRSFARRHEMKMTTAMTTTAMATSTPHRFLALILGQEDNPLDRRLGPFSDVAEVQLIKCGLFPSFLRET